jgi:O-antigen ligase
MSKVRLKAPGSVFVPLLFFLTPLVTSAIPKLTWLFLPLVAIALAVPVLLRETNWRRLIEPNSATVALLILAGYLFVNASWAADRPAAFGKAALFLGVIAITFLVSRAISEANEEQLSRAAMAFSIGAFVGAAFVISELLTHGAITRLAMNAIPLIKTTSPKRVSIEEGKIAYINLSDLNRNVAIVMLNLWPGLLTLGMVEGRMRRLVLAGIFFTVATVAVAASQHQSSQVALIASMPVFVAAHYWPKFTVRTLAAAWCVAFVLVVPLDLFAYKSEFQAETWLPPSFRARIVIWGDTAERALQHPWLGIGIKSTPALKESSETAEEAKGFDYPVSTGQHAHDLFLQTWYEMGLIGAILVALAGASVALCISLLPAASQPFAAATFMAFMSIAAFGWGMWQTWLMCAVALTLLYLCLTARATVTLPVATTSVGKFGRSPGAQGGAHRAGDHSAVLEFSSRGELEG